MARQLIGAPWAEDAACSRNRALSDERLSRLSQGSASVTATEMRPRTVPELALMHIPNDNVRLRVHGRSEDAAWAWDNEKEQARLHHWPCEEDVANCITSWSSNVNIGVVLASGAVDLPPPRESDEHD